MPKSIPTPHTSHSDVKNQLLDAMHSCEAGSEEFNKVLSQYQTLCSIETASRRENKWLAPLIPALGNVLGIGVMGIFEIKGPAIFTSKALNVFGGKLK